MASKVIGLDLGHAAIKAAILKGTYRGFEVVDYITRPLPLHELDEADDDGPSPLDDAAPGSLDGTIEDVDAVAADRTGEVPALGPASRREALRAMQLREARMLLDGIDTDDATYVVAIPAAQVSNWVVEVPFTQAKQIGAVLPGVLEERIPFDLDDVVVHSHTLESGPAALDGAPGTRLFCGMARRDELRGLLDELSGIGVDPRFLPVDAGALVNLQRFLPADTPGHATVLMDVGHHSTKLCVTVGGVPLLLRTLDWGGAAVDRALQDRYSFAPGELADYKRGVVTLADNSEDDDIRAMAASVREATRPLVALLRATLVAFEEERGLDVDRIYVCGGGSELRGLNGFIGGELGLRVEDLPTPPTAGTLEPAADQMLAYALALRGLASGKPQQVDFRIEQFAYRRDIVRMQRVGMVAAILLLVVAFVGIGMSVVNGVRLKARDAALMDEIRSTVRAVFPNVAESALVTSGSAVSVFTAEMDTLNAKVAMIDPSRQVTAFDQLKELSQAVPKEHKIDVDYLEITPEAIKLRANTDKFETVDKIEGALQDKPRFAQAAAHDKVKNSRDNTTRFEMTIPLGEAEE